MSVILKSKVILKLRHLSRTRLVARAESVHAVKLSYKQIIESMYQIESKFPSFEAPTTRMTSNLRIKVLSDKFIVSLFFIEEVKSKTKFSTTAKLNIIDTMTPIDANASNFRYMMNDNKKVE